MYSIVRSLPYGARDILEDFGHTVVSVSIRKLDFESQPVTDMDLEGQASCSQTSTLQTYWQFWNVSSILHIACLEASYLNIGSGRVLLFRALEYTSVAMAVSGTLVSYLRLRAFVAMLEYSL